MLYRRICQYFCEVEEGFEQVAFCSWRRESLWVWLAAIKPYRILCGLTLLVQDYLRLDGVIIVVIGCGSRS